MEKLERKDVDSVMNILKAMNAIIFDVRYSASGTMYDVSKYLKKEKTDFTRWFYPNLEYPGLITYADNLQCGPDSINEEYYEGLVVILVGNYTQSHSEFTVMGLQTAPNSITIGSQTAGADGNVSTVSLPGGIITYFSGAGLAYPDGTETQRKGLKIDIVVNQTINNIRKGRDEKLDTALAYIKSQQ
jgi:C-terminal processing protease CtpA/Prc